TLAILSRPGAPRAGQLLIDVIRDAGLARARTVLVRRDEPLGCRLDERSLGRRQERERQRLAAKRLLLFWERLLRFLRRRFSRLRADLRRERRRSSCGPNPPDELLAFQ